MKFDITLKDVTPEVLAALSKFIGEYKTSEPVKGTPVKDIPVDNLYNAIAATENKPQIPSAPYMTEKYIADPIAAAFMPPPAELAAAHASHTMTMTPQAGAPEVDGNGLPWDERIHAGTKTKTEKNVWKKRKGATPQLIAQVEAELRATPRMINVSIDASPSPLIQPPVLEAPRTFYRGDLGQPPAPAAAPIPAAPAIPQTNSFQGLMATISGLFANGGATPDYLKTLCDAISKGFQLPAPLAAITDIAQNQQMIDYAFTILKHDGKIA